MMVSPLQWDLHTEPSAVTYPERHGGVDWFQEDKLQFGWMGPHFLLHFSATHKQKRRRKTSKQWCTGAIIIAKKNNTKTKNKQTNKKKQEKQKQLLYSYVSYTVCIVHDYTKNTLVRGKYARARTSSKVRAFLFRTSIRGCGRLGRKPIASNLRVLNKT